MSLDFKTNNNCNCNCNTNRIQSPHFSRRMWIRNLPDSIKFTGGNLPVVKEEEDSGSSSSIGNNSDSDEDDNEVQSKVNEPKNNLNDLEQVLPIKRGISMFYDGKSKSYGTLGDVVSVSSIQDIVKPEDAYSRKRKNKVANQVLFEKRCRSDLIVGLKSHSHDKSTSVSPLSKKTRKVLTNASLVSSPKLYRSPCRSLSLSDLQRASSITG